MMILIGPDVMHFASVYVVARARLGSMIVTVQLALLVGSAVDVALMVACPPLTEVTTPPALTVAMYVSLDAQVTVVVTVAVSVCETSGVGNEISVSLRVTETGAAPVSVAAPSSVASAPASLPVPIPVSGPASVPGCWPPDFWQAANTMTRSKAPGLNMAGNAGRGPRRSQNRLPSRGLFVAG